MNRVINWFTRKKILVFSLLSSICFFVLIPKKVLFFVCDAHNSWCVNIFGYFLLIFLFGLSVFIPSVIMFFVKQKVFESWKKTLFIYLFIYLFILLFIPWSAGDAFLRVQKDLIAIGVSVVYSLISVLLIIYQSFKKE